MAGKRVIFRTEDEKIWIWEAATGNKLGEPLETHEEIEVVASVDGSLLCLTRDGHVTVWNPVLRRLERRVDLPGGAYRSLAAGRIDCVPAFVTGGEDGELHVHSPLPAGDYVRAVALNDNLVAAGCSDGSVLVWDLHSELERRRDARAEVNAVALGSHPATGDLLLVVGTSEPAALIWNLDGSSFTSSWRPFPDHDEVRSVALVYLAGDPVVAAASDHGDVWVGNQASPSLPFKLPHPAKVTTVEFGDVDGQMMLATTCLDGNTRLWETRESARRPDAHGRPGLRPHVAGRGRGSPCLRGA
jgi:WD40 repeat protein